MDHFYSLKYVLVLSCFIKVMVVDCKYVEGELRTSEDWAFLARFCFLSEQGTFEYYFAFDPEQGIPNLLLYYDSNSQWPAVYKTSKTCRQKESVLNVEQNQIINLTVNFPYNELSGCTYQILNEDHTHTVKPKTTSRPTKAKTYTVNVDGYRKTTRSTTTTVSTTTQHVSNHSYNEFFEFDNVTEPLDNITDDFDSENIFSDDIVNTTETHQNDGNKIIKKRSAPGAPPDKYKNAVITCRNARKFRSARERWWFVAISNCDGTKGIDLRYQILMTNGPPGDYWHEHFSADEFYVLPVLMAFSTAYGMLFFAIIMCSVELKSRQLLHSTYKLFVLSVLFQLFGIALQSLVYLKYAVTGIVPYRVKVVGGVLMGCSETTFLLVLLLLAKGYTTTRGRLPLAASIKLTIFMCLYAITYVTLFIYEVKVFDPGEVLYLYESPAGYGLISLRVIAWWMFIYSTIFTLKHYPEKSNFYYPFNICGTLWFVAGPAFILSANSYIDKWVRESIVYGVLLFITFAGHLMFLVLTLPAMANKNFPYHIRTTQIGVMELNGSAGHFDQYGHQIYQPTMNIEQTVIIPLNPRTDDFYDSFNQRNENVNTENTQKLPTSEEEMSTRILESDVNMDNVLKWSTVKGLLNTNTLALPSRTGSATSEGDRTPSECTTLSPTEIFRQKSNIDPLEWTRDVPVELFTISRLVVNKQNQS